MFSWNPCLACSRRHMCGLDQFPIYLGTSCDKRLMHGKSRHISNTLRTIHYGRHFAEEIIICTFVNEKLRIWLYFHWSFFLSIELDNGLAPNTRQAIIWTNAGPIHRHIFMRHWGRWVNDFSLWLRSLWHALMASLVGNIIKKYIFHAKENVFCNCHLWCCVC